MTTLLDRIHHLSHPPQESRLTWSTWFPHPCPSHQVRKEGSRRERRVLYLPGRLATFITLDPVTGVHGCLFHDVVHDDGWFLGVLIDYRNDARDLLFIRHGQMFRIGESHSSLFGATIVSITPKGRSTLLSIHPLAVYVKMSALPLSRHTSPISTPNLPKCTHQPGTLAICYLIY